MGAFKGVVLDAEFVDPGIVNRFDVFATRLDVQNGWTCFGIRVPEEKLENTIALIQEHLKDGAPFYAHLWDEARLIVIFKRAVFRFRGDPSTWAPAREYGRRTLKIPEDQLDFWPHTAEQEAECFPETGV